MHAWLFTASLSSHTYHFYPLCPTQTVLGLHRLQTHTLHGRSGEVTLQKSMWGGRQGNNCLWKVICHTSVDIYCASISQNDVWITEHPDMEADVSFINSWIVSKMQWELPLSFLLVNTGSAGFCILQLAGLSLHSSAKEAKEWLRNILYITVSSKSSSFPNDYVWGKISLTAGHMEKW